MHSWIVTSVWSEIIDCLSIRISIYLGCKSPGCINPRTNTRVKHHLLIYSTLPCKNAPDLWNYKGISCTRPLYVIPLVAVGRSKNFDYFLLKKLFCWFGFVIWVDIIFGRWKCRLYIEHTYHNTLCRMAWGDLVGLFYLFCWETASI